MLLFRSLHSIRGYIPHQSVSFSAIRRTMTAMNGDLNNTAAMRIQREIETDATYHGRSFAIPSSEDVSSIQEQYRPFLLDDATTENDWIAKLELNTTLKLVDSEILKKGKDRLKVLVLYGSLRER
jgi:arsenic resistance protein ArsH